MDCKPSVYLLLSAAESHIVELFSDAKTMQDMISQYRVSLRAGAIRAWRHVAAASLEHRRSVQALEAGPEADEGAPKIRRRWRHLIKSEVPVDLE